MRRLGRAIFTSAIAVALFAPSVRAESDALFEKGNQSYVHGDYPAAIDAYEQVLGAGVVHEDLHYNLGNAYFRADRLGPAILHYEKALELDPSQDDALANLKLARETAAQRFQDKLPGAERDPWWMRALQPFTVGGLTIAFLALYVSLFALALAFYLLSPGFLRVATGVVLTFVVVGTIGGGALLGGRWWLGNRVERGVVLPDEVSVKEAPDPTAQTSFFVHGGLNVRVSSRDQEWIRVRLANGLEGWVRDRDVGRL